MKDGWHTICGYDVWVENNRVLRGTKCDHNHDLVTAYPYRRGKTGGWDNCSGISVSTFRALVTKGDLTMS